MKLQHLYEQSKGQQVLAFARYLSDVCTCTDAEKDVLEEFGGYLFERDWTLLSGTSYCEFNKGNISEGKYHIIMPTLASAMARKTPLPYAHLSYFKDAPDPAKLATSRYVSIQISDLDTMVDEMRTFVNAVTAISK